MSNFLHIAEESKGNDQVYITGSRDPFTLNVGYTRDYMIIIYLHPHLPLLTLRLLPPLEEEC